jgi:hypothetical protein
MFQTKHAEKIKTNILRSHIPPPPPPRKSCRLWGNVEKCRTAREATDDNATRRMHFACWITKATTHTFRICSTHCFSKATTVKRTRLNVSYTLLAWLVITWTECVYQTVRNEYLNTIQVSVRLWSVNQIKDPNYKLNSMSDSITHRLSLHHFTGNISSCETNYSPSVIFFTQSWNFNRECRAASWFAAVHFRGILSLTNASHSCDSEVR